MKTPALDHLPDSVAGAAVFDPMPHVGLAVGSNEAQLQRHPMVHEGRCKHLALHLRYHLQVQLRDALERPGDRQWWLMAYPLQCLSGLENK